MKKKLLFAILACLFVSCSSDGSREIQIEEVAFVPNTEMDNSEIEKVSSIFEVLPGKYELSWKLIKDHPGGNQIYNISLKLKLKLNRKVSFKDAYLEKIKKESFAPMDGIRFRLQDADGKVNDAVAGFIPGMIVNNDENPFDRDLLMEFVDFLQSNPGTEKEFVFNSSGSVITSNGWDCTKICKDAKSIVCEVESDSSFEYDYGVIN